MGAAAAEERAIVLAAGTAERRAAGLAADPDWAVALDWERFAARLRWRRLLPLLGPRLIELAGDRSDPGFAAAVAEALESGRRQSALIELISQRVVVSLGEAGIRAAPLKGPILSERLYGDAGRRLSSDIDLLVAPEQLGAAVAVARGLGYEAPRDPVGEDGMPRLHFALVHGRGELPPLELHWRIHWYEGEFAAQRLLPPALDPLSQWQPEPLDELIALLLYYARDGFLDARQPTDVGAWWDGHGAATAAGSLAARLRPFPALVPATRAAARACERLVGLPAAHLLGPAPRLGARGRLALRMANPNPTAPAPQLYADRGLVDGLLTPPGGLRAFVRRQLLPPRSVLDQQAEHGERERSRSALGRFLGVLGRYGLRGAGLACGREPAR
jgi:hypothetical protein